ncbi:hypothetical protein [Microbacterium sp.]|uniref:hypothetical protein n=1 Tax=Microbacterium sp. TaxID=51671 RepID=UPI0033422013
MVEPQRTRYVPTDAGAPPVPPPGGYHGARRQQTPGLPSAAAAVTAEAETPKQRSGPFGLIVLIASVLFALILLGMLLGGASAIYSVTMIVLQLVLLAAIVTSLFTARGRMLGAVALVIALLFNVATVGALGALQASATQSYKGVKSDKQRHAEAYPGVKGTSNQSVLSQPSLEKVQADGEALMAEIRARLTERFGYTWVKSGASGTRNERNGYGGESMLQQYGSETWTTAEPVRDNARKRQIMSVIDNVLASRGMSGLYALNEPGTGISDDMIAKLYGSADPGTQHTWEWYGDAYPDPLRFYADIFDLSKDPTGEFRTDREAKNADTGEPLEGVQLFIIARQVLSEKDRAEFEKRIQEYSGF